MTFEQRNDGGEISHGATGRRAEGRAKQWAKVEWHLEGVGRLRVADTGVCECVCNNMYYRLLWWTSSLDFDSLSRAKNATHLKHCGGVTIDQNTDAIAGVQRQLKKQRKLQFSLLIWFQSASTIQVYELRQCGCLYLMAMNLLVKVSLLVKASPENSPSHSQQLDQFQGILANHMSFYFSSLHVTTLS